MSAAIVLSDGSIFTLTNLSSSTSINEVVLIFIYVIIDLNVFKRDTGYLEKDNPRTGNNMVDYGKSME